MRPARLAVVAARRLGLQVRPLGPGTLLVSRPRRPAERWPEVERSLGAYVAQQHVAHLLRMYRVNCVLDVGANRGQYAGRLRRGGYEGHIASFEPVPETFAALAGAAARDPRWRVYPWALGEEDGTAEINVVPGTMSSLLAATRFGAGRYKQLREPQTEEVAIRRLDGVLDEVLAPVPDPRPYLKLDTQGYDLQVFEGLGERVEELVGMQSELALMPVYEGQPRLPEALERYEAAGFGVTALYPVSRQSRTSRLVEVDCIMVRAPAP